MAIAVPALVGRQRELALFRSALEAAEGGTPRVVALRGEAGIGKSRLLSEFVADARARGHVLLHGRASELERDVPFALLVDALDDLVRTSEPLVRRLGDEHLATLAAALPALRALRPEVAPAATGERHTIARAVRALLAGLAAERPLVLVLDDVHWCDPATADVVALLVHRPPQGRILLALAARPRRVSSLESVLEAGARHGHVEVVDVPPLAPTDAATLLPGLRRSARERVVRDSGGNPFYALALARGGIADGAGSVESGVPAAVRAALASELADVSPASRLVLEGAAVVGDPFEPTLAGIAAAVADGAALAALDELVAADLVRPTETPWRFGFRHPLVRRAVYEAAGAGWRLAAHGRVADALAERDASLAQLAHHVERAAQPGDLEAVELLRAAATGAVAAAPATAAGWYRAARRLLPQTTEHDELRWALLAEQGGALARAGRVVKARDVLARALAVMPAASPARVPVAISLADQLLWTDDTAAARRTLTAEREALGEAFRAEAAELTFALAGERAWVAEHAAAERLAEEAREQARACGDRALEAEAAALAVDAAHCRLRVDDARELERVERRLEEASELIDGLPDDIVTQRLPMLLWMATAQHFTGRFAEALAASGRGLRLARESGAGTCVPSFLAALAVHAVELGDLDAAQAASDEALETALVAENHHIAFWASGALSAVALARGEVDEAIVQAESAWSYVGVQPYSQAGMLLADARLAAGDVAAALRALETFGWVNPALWTFDRLKATEVCVRALLAAGRLDEAAERASLATAEVGGRRTGVFGALLALVDGQIQLAQDEPAAAAERALAGAEMAAGAGAPVWSGRCRTLAGEALARAGEAEAARVELRAAASELETRGALGYRDAALRTLRRLGERPRPRSTASGDALRGPAALTPREAQVAELLAEGRTNRQIAAQLYLSEKTVEKHVSAVMAKLGVATRAAVGRAVERAGGTAASR